MGVLVTNPPNELLRGKVNRILLGLLYGLLRIFTQITYAFTGEIIGVVVLTYCISC
jgi:hypothetical protein